MIKFIFGVILLTLPQIFGQYENGQAGFDEISTDLEIEQFLDGTTRNDDLDMETTGGNYGQNVQPARWNNEQNFESVDGNNGQNIQPARWNNGQYFESTGGNNGQNLGATNDGDQGTNSRGSSQFVCGKPFGRQSRSQWEPVSEGDERGNGGTFTRKTKFGLEFGINAGGGNPSRMEMADPGFDAGMGYSSRTDNEFGYFGGKSRQSKTQCLQGIGERIVGGEVASHKNWPWQVSIRRNNSPICGGTLISNLYVVTAAHCFRMSKNPAVYSVAFGKNHKRNKEPGEIIIGASKIIVHSAHGQGHNHNNDIAMIRLVNPIKFSEKAVPICLPKPGRQLLDGRSVTITGYGKTKGSAGENFLNVAKVNYISQRKCRALPKYRSITDNMICAGILSGGTDACQGDSGGPLVVKSCTTGRWTLYGVTSYGFGCAVANQPGVYTRIPNYLSWMLGNMKY